MPEELVTIGRYIDPTAAHVARSVLEAHGIESQVMGEFTGNLEPVFNILGGTSKGGIRLLVRAEDAEEATALLTEDV